MFSPTIYEKLTRYCSYQERCVSDVTHKLRTLKAESGDFETYFARLKQENFLNEDRFVKAFVAGHVRKKWGKVKIRTALTGKRIEFSLVKKYLDEMNEENYDEQILLAAQKKVKTIKGDTSWERKNKLTKSLLSKGYEMGKILIVLKEMKF